MNAQDIIAAARRMAPGIAARAGEIEVLRRLPDDLVAEMRAAGLYSMAMPRSRGGPQMTLMDQIRVVEILSVADASVGWCIKIGGDSGYFAGVMDPAVVDELMPGLDTILAGFAPPGPGRLDRVEGGYMLNGCFPFGSGSAHADLFFATATVFEADGTPAQGGQWGGAVPRMAFVKRDQIAIEDTWHTSGLAGTGSNHWVARDLFVPDRHTLDPFTQVRRTDMASYAHTLNFTATLGGVPLGIMARAIEEATQFAHEKTVLFPPPPRPLKQLPQARGIVAEAVMIQRSARAFLFDAAQTHWDALEADGEAPPEVRATLGLAMAHCCRAACDVTRRLFDFVGTGAIHKEAVMGRLLRDAMAANQHVTVSQNSVETLGGVLLGTPHPSPFY